MKLTVHEKTAAEEGGFARPTGRLRYRRRPLEERLREVPTSFPDELDEHELWDIIDSHDSRGGPAIQNNRRSYALSWGERAKKNRARSGEGPTEGVTLFALSGVLTLWNSFGFAEYYVTGKNRIWKKTKEYYGADD